MDQDVAFEKKCGRSSWAQSSELGPHGFLSDMLYEGLECRSAYCVSATVLWCLTGVFVPLHVFVLLDDESVSVSVFAVDLFARAVCRQRRVRWPRSSEHPLLVCLFRRALLMCASPFSYTACLNSVS